MKCRAALGFALCLFAVPGPVLANAGTPLMITGMWYLVFGNALIGVAEGGLLAWMFRLPYGRSIGLLVLANYVSAWGGGMFLRSWIVSRASLDIDNAWSFFWLMVAATYGITLVLEWPFVAWAVRAKARWLLKAIGGSLVVQTASYVVIFSWYWCLSGTSLYTETKLVDLAAMALPEDVLLLYISADDGDVYERPLARAEDCKVLELDSTGLDDRLFFRETPGDESRRELAVVCQAADRREAKVVSTGHFFVLEAVPATQESGSGEPRFEGNWFSFGEAARLGSARDSGWQFSTGFWPLEGLRAQRGEDPQSRRRVCYETPFGHWVARNAIHLPTDKVLFQLGPDQICVYDPQTRQIALVARGRGPTAMLKQQSVSAEVPAGP